jgi:hypothetical protein
VSVTFPDGLCLKCGTRQFEQDHERVCLMIIHVRVRDKRLEDVIADGSFLHISEIGPACDEMCARIKIPRGRVPGMCFYTPHVSRVTTKEILENPCAEAALKTGVVRSENVVRLHVAGKTKDQVGSRMDEFTAFRFDRVPPSVVQDSIEEQVGRDLVISLCNRVYLSHYF